MINRLIRAACILGVLLLGLLPSFAADPLLDQIKPQGAQRGTQVEVTFLGQRLLDAPYQVLLYDSGIEVSDIQKVEADGKQIKCTLSLAKDCRLGQHALRLRTASGISNLVTFHVSNLQEIVEAEPNNTAGESQNIATDVVVNGSITSGDTDVYAIEVTAGERLSVEIEGLRLGRTFFDPLIALYDQQGELLLQSDDQPATHQDPFTSIQVKHSGKIFIHVREVAYRGGNAATYRLHVGHFPRPTAWYPPVATPGESIKVQWLGTDDDKATQTIKVPQTDQKIFHIHPSDELGASPTSLPLYLAALPPNAEVEPNNQHQQANELTLPGIAYGIISEAKDKDFYQFSIKKGEEWEFRVRARELRSRLDPVLHIFNSKRRYLKGNDDNAGKPDSYLRFKAPEDGLYTLDVEDRLLRGHSDMVYVVEVTKPSPSVTLQLEERSRYKAQVINVPQGGRTAAMMTVKRNNLSGPLQIEWDNLLPGVTAKSSPIPANYHRVPILFMAQPQAELNAALASVTAQLTKKPKPFVSSFRQQTWLVRGRNNRPVWSHFADRPAISVSTPLPYSIRAIEPKAPLVQNGSMELKIVAEREEGFEQPIAIRTIYNPPGVSTNQSRSIPKGSLEAFIPITANAKARIGNWQLAFLGKSNISGQVETSTQLVPLRIAKPYFDIKIPSLTVLPGNTVHLTVALKHHTPFSGEAELELRRLPPGVTANKVKVKSDSESATFELQVSKDARTGRHQGVGCGVLLTIEGEPVRYSQGYVDLHIDPTPAKTLPKAAASKNRLRGQTS